MNRPKRGLAGLLPAADRFPPSSFSLLSGGGGGPDRANRAAGPTNFFEFLLPFLDRGGDRIGQRVLISGSAIPLATNSRTLLALPVGAGGAPEGLTCSLSATVHTFGGQVRQWPQQRRTPGGRLLTGAAGAAKMAGSDAEIGPVAVQPCSVPLDAGPHDARRHRRRVCGARGA
jgi:hypothetical protein